VTGGDVDVFKLSTDNTRIAYIAAQKVPDTWEVFEVDLAQPSVTTKISNPMTYDDAYWFDYAEDDTHIVYMAAQDSEFAELFDVTLAQPGVSTRLNSTLVSGGEVWDFLIAP
jgi:hypothetical protein